MLAIVEAKYPCSSVASICSALSQYFNVRHPRHGSISMLIWIQINRNPQAHDATMSGSRMLGGARKRQMKGAIALHDNQSCLLTAFPVIRRMAAVIFRQPRLHSFGAASASGIAVGHA